MIIDGKHFRFCMVFCDSDLHCRLPKHVHIAAFEQSRALLFAWSCIKTEGVSEKRDLLRGVCMCKRKDSILGRHGHPNDWLFGERYSLAFSPVSLGMPDTSKGSWSRQGHSSHLEEQKVGLSDGRKSQDTVTSWIVRILNIKAQRRSLKSFNRSELWLCYSVLRVVIFWPWITPFVPCRQRSPSRTH